MKYLLALAFFALSSASLSLAQVDSEDHEHMEMDMGAHHHHDQSMAETPQTQLGYHVNLFGVGMYQTGQRGRQAVASPEMIMLNFDLPSGAKSYWSLETMLTFERWTFPQTGYPLFTQIGEANELGAPYLDAQHPHSSPLMGLMLSHNWNWSETSGLKLFAAPRGESTDGPVAFMHRLTGEVNPDAPLGHHVGQDVGHISSTVIGAKLRFEKFDFEVSGFNGLEPFPMKIDLPVGSLNSIASRLTYRVNDDVYFMASAAYQGQPDSTNPSLAGYGRYSGSVYSKREINEGPWTWHNSLIYGQITNLDQTPKLESWGEEFVFENQPSQIWGRIEYLQRTPEELAIPAADAPDQFNPRWVTALTLGYTFNFMHFDELMLGVGASYTYDLLPNEFKNAYSGNPSTAKIFLRLGAHNVIGL